MNTLEDVIRNSVELHTGSRNWMMTRCAVCNDHFPGSSNFKGYRGGFKFEGDVVGYHCFNCGHAAKFDPSTSNRLSVNMQKIIDAFNIPQDAVNNVLFDNMISPNGTHSLQIKKKAIPIKEIKLPIHSYPLLKADENDKWAIIAKHYLINQRLIDPKSYPFYLCKGESLINKKWKGRLIIPIYNGNKLVYYSGRSLIPSMIPKYDNVSADRGKIIYNYKVLREYTDKPIFIVEGFFDALLLDGVAIFGKTLSEEQIAIINQSSRQKVVIPDQFGDGKRLAQQAIKCGWSVSTPDIGSCKDVTEAFLKYGELYTLKTIMDNIHHGISATLNIEIYCK